MDCGVNFIPTEVSSENLPDLVFFIGAKMEPSRKNLSLPRFASNSTRLRVATTLVQKDHQKSRLTEPTGLERRDRATTRCN